MKFLAPVIVDNVTAVAAGQAPTKSIPAKLPVFAAISMGPSFGVFVQNSNVMAGEGFGKGKFDFTENYLKIYGGAHEILVGQKAYLDQTYKDLCA